MPPSLPYYAPLLLILVKLMKVVLYFGSLKSVGNKNFCNYMIVWAPDCILTELFDSLFGVDAELDAEAAVTLSQ